MLPHHAVTGKSPASRPPAPSHPPAGTLTHRETRKHETAPKLINIVAGGLTPELDAAELGRLGYAIAIYPTTALLAVANAPAESGRRRASPAFSSAAIRAAQASMTGQSRE